MSHIYRRKRATGWRFREHLIERVRAWARIERRSAQETAALLLERGLEGAETEGRLVPAGDKEKRK